MGTSFYRFVTMHAFDRQTDRRTEMPRQYSVLHHMQSHGKNYKTLHEAHVIILAY